MKKRKQVILGNKEQSTEKSSVQSSEQSSVQSTVQSPIQSSVHSKKQSNGTYVFDGVGILAIITIAI